jgi:hypothetical protein
MPGTQENPFIPFIQWVLERHGGSKSSPFSRLDLNSFPQQTQVWGGGRQVGGLCCLLQQEEQQQRSLDWIVWPLWAGCSGLCATSPEWQSKGGNGTRAVGGERAGGERATPELHTVGLKRQALSCLFNHGKPRPSGHPKTLLACSPSPRLIGAPGAEVTTSMV